MQENQSEEKELEKDLQNEEIQDNQTSDNQAENTDNNAESSDNVANKNADSQENNKEEDYKAKYEEINDKYLRLAAEFDNYRKRTLKEKMDLTKYASGDVLKDILPVVDNMERALKALETAKDMDAVKEGIVLIYNKFKEFLSQKGVKEIESMGLELNCDLHEAITKFAAPSEELKGKIIDVVEKGYYLNDKVIRFAKVVVGE